MRVEQLRKLEQRDRQQDISTMPAVCWCSNFGGLHYFAWKGSHSKLARESGAKILLSCRDYSTFPRQISGFTSQGAYWYIYLISRNRLTTANFPCTRQSTVKIKPPFWGMSTCFGYETKTGVVHILVIFQDKIMFSHIKGKLPPRPFEWYGWT